MNIRITSLTVRYFVICKGKLILSCFRLENEHLNNVGKYRAFKTVPLPFTYYSDNEEDDEVDKDD